MALYPATLKFDESSQANYSVRSNKTDFGDGYQSVVPDGINYIVQNGNIVHRDISITDANTIRAFLRANCGTSTKVTIQNLMEDPTGATTLDVYLESWSERYLGKLYTFTVKYRQAF